MLCGRRKLLLKQSEFSRQVGYEYPFKLCKSRTQLNGGKTRVVRERQGLVCIVNITFGPGLRSHGFNSYNWNSPVSLFSILFILF